MHGQQNIKSEPMFLEWATTLPRQP